MATTGQKAKAAGAIAAGGGPEDPVGDAVAIKELTGSSGADGGGAPKAAKDTAAEGGKKAKAQAKKQPKGPPSRKRRALGWAWSDNRKLLLAEFILCVAVLGLGTIVSPEDSKHDVPRAMIKGSALAGIFFLLALISSGGQKPARAANALGTLITAAYVLTSADVHNIVSWLSGFFRQPAAGAAEGGGISSGGAGAGGAAEGGGMTSGEVQA